MAIPTTYPAPAPPLASAFAVPTTDQVSQNQDFWNGYKAGQATAPQNCPSATNIVDWATYHAKVLMALPNYAPWNSLGDGSNQAVIDASDWEWVWNPLSGHNKVIS